MLEQSMLLQRPLALLKRVAASFQTHRWQWIGGILCFALVNGYIAYRLYRDWGEIQNMDWSWLKPNVPLLLLAAAMQLIGVLTAVYSWKYVLEQFGYAISFRRHFKVYALSSLARRLPGVGWDILSRAYMYGQDGSDKIQVSVASVAELVIFAVSSCFVALVILVLPGSHASYINPLILWGALILFLALVVSPLFGRLINWLQRNNQTTVHLRWQHMLAWVFMNAITITIGGASLFVFASAFGLVGITALMPLIQGWALTVASGILLSWIPVDIGVTSGVTVLVLATFMPLPQALILLVAWRIWNMLNELVWGGVGFAL